MGFYATAEVKEKNRYYPVFRGNKSENRLVKTESGSSVPDEFKVCVENEYDYLGRRFRKTVKDDYSGGTYTTTNVTTYIWNGWNIIAEMCDAGYTNYNTFGLDLSGTLQGAGGVGGLLAVTRVDDTGTNSYFPCFDGNGNVCQYVDESGSVVAAREYSPFGVSIALTGDKKNDFTHWWSTKPFDAETGIVVYEQRPYIPGLGRWGCREPFGEASGEINLYAFVQNSPVNRTDYLGLMCLIPALPNPPGWQNGDFVDHFYGGSHLPAGATVFLDDPQVNLMNEYQTSPDVDLFRYTTVPWDIQNEVNTHDPCCTPGDTFYGSKGPQNVAAANIFVMQSGRIKAQWRCECQSGGRSYRCKMLFTGTDAFSDPLNMGSIPGVGPSIPGPIQNVGGTPYDIQAQWTDWRNFAIGATFTVP